jgi:UDP-N-acetylmuramoylalanine-D-glutamate ligase
MFVDDLKMLGIDVGIGLHSYQILDSDFIINSPGIPYDSEILGPVYSEKIPVISAIEFAGNPSKTKNICITGTNGKTTTVSLVTEILSKEMNVLKSGNIGIPFSKIVLENKLYDQNNIDYCILELSSFQLEPCSKLKKEISVILNISLDHMDRYDSFEDYFETQIKIFENAKYCLFNYDDNFLNERIKSNDKNIIPFSISEEKGYKCYDTNKILSNGPRISIDIQDISIRGYS